MRKFFCIMLPIAALVLTGCRKSVDLNAVMQQVGEHYDMVYGEGSWQAEIRLSEQSPLLAEAVFPDSSVCLISIEPGKSKVKDYLQEPAAFLHVDTLPVSDDLFIERTHSASYVCTTDSSLRITTDSIYCLVGESDSAGELYHLQRTTLYVLRDLHFERVISEENMLKDWYEHDVCRNFTSNSGAVYNDTYLQLYAQLSAGDSLTFQQVMDIIPSDEEQYHIYHAGELLGDSLRMLVMQTVDSAVVAHVTFSYALMNQYLQTIQWADDVEVKAMLATFKQMDDANPLLFRQTACYLFTDPDTKFIKDAIEEHPDEWYEAILIEEATANADIAAPVKAAKK